MTARDRFRDEVRLVPRVELVAEIFDVPFDRSRGDPELLRTLFRRKTPSDALEHFPFPLR